MKPPALFRPRLTPNPNAPGRSRSFTQSPPRQPASAGSLVANRLLTRGPARQPETLPMLRFSCLLAVIAVLSRLRQRRAPNRRILIGVPNAIESWATPARRPGSRPRPPLKRSISVLREGERILQPPLRPNRRTEARLADGWARRHAENRFRGFEWPRRAMCLPTARPRLGPAQWGKARSDRLSRVPG